MLIDNVVAALEGYDVRHGGENNEVVGGSAGGDFDDVVILL